MRYIHGISIRLLSFIFMMLTLASCVNEETYDNSPSGNLEALWRIMDEHYCYFDYKKEQLGVDWNEVHSRYSSQVSDKMSRYQLFDYLGRMIGELQDGHVNLSSAFDLSRNWSWKEDYPSNFSDTLHNRYIGTDYRYANGIKYRILRDNVGYMYCGSFANPFGAGNLDEIMLHLAPCTGLIVDVRNNGGGMVTSAETLAERFTNEDVLVGYMQHKTGKGHNDFSSPQPQYIHPAAGLRWQKPVVVITNRAVFSAANEFVKYMKAMKRVVIVGDTTGGGAGMPFSSELPNGWGVRFSACPMYDADMHSTEHGIAPHHFVSQTDEDFAQGYDTLIEFARKLINN